MLKELQAEAKELIRKGYKKICFFQPAYNIGGGPYIEAMLAKYLSQNTPLEVFFCDFNNGYGSWLLSDYPGVKILQYNEQSLDFPLQEKCVVFTNSTRVILLQKMHPETKILFWHYETVKVGWNSVFLNNEQYEFLKLIKLNKAIIYHDWSGRDSLGINQKITFTNEEYLHITLPPKTLEAPSKLIEEETLHIAWLSRLAPDKIYSLFYLIDNLAKYKTTKKKILHIIGDGVSRKKVEDFCKSYNKDINFIFTGNIQHDLLDEYLINNVDLMFGVGTCVLECAALKIPSVVLLIDSKKIIDKDAFWIFNSKEYCVGILKEEKERFNIKYSSISDILDCVYEKENGKKEYGELSYKYFKKYHTDYDTLVVSFLSYVNQCTLNYKKLHNFLKYIPYKLLNKTEYKIFNICFFKKIIFANNTKYYLFGILFYKIKRKGNINKHYFLGVHVLSKVTRVPWKFPAALFKDKFVKK